jgi:Doubled CXXCH motif (Paired_CXXCH_1)
MHLPQRSAAALLAGFLLLADTLTHAQIAPTNKISDVRGTKHNFSAVPDGSATPSGGTVPARAVKATSETQVCVFCHTPHEAETVSFGGGSTALGAPLWNRKLSGQTYTLYSSTSMEADAAELATQPGGSSKLCLSCHDGTMGIDKVNALNGAKNATIAMTTPTGPAPSPVKVPGNSATGFTRNLGTDLSADHPISFTYSAALANLDGELRNPDGALVGNRVAGSAKPKLPLENNQMQCSTCHDPHLRDKTTSNGNAKFLRMNRFQVTQPVGGAFSDTNDIICLACHDKGGSAWAFSAHANSLVATQSYTPEAARQREFPSTLNVPANANPPVWQVGCLNCHDTHTVQGARRLLREGTDSAAKPKIGGAAALEETCYQCHTTSADSAVSYITQAANAVPDIKSDFALGRHMPIKSSEQAAGTETHNVGGAFNDGPDTNCSKLTGKCGKDLLESRSGLGLDNANNRHAECSDCHNPHRVIKTQNGLPGPLSAGNTNDKAGTHRHEDAVGYIHTNVISGVLRGSFGVEPVYGGSSFEQMPLSFTAKRGDPGASSSILVSEKFVTREYQICLKCHSNYAYTDDNIYPNGATRPLLGGLGLTPPNSNNQINFSRYTNQAKEFQAPISHSFPVVGGVSLGFDGGAGATATNAATNNNNHRSWHPVMAPTGRTERPAGGFRAPWNNAGAVGKQTMYCSDCHGSSTPNGTAMPAGNTNTFENGKPWGPHGSENNFLLKGKYDAATGAGQADALCFKCHNASSYASKDGSGTGFQTSDKGDGHAVHADRIDSGIKCNYCHVAVPHGWKNRGLLVNMNDVGPEAGLPPGTVVSYPNKLGYTNGPYYRNAFLKVTSFPSGRTWSENNCNGGRDGMKTNCESGP